ncbi:MAG: class I SAM-dependent methyltransferase [Pseudomonadota bacterium]
MMAHEKADGKPAAMASFGYEEVAAHDKARLVGRVFSSVARRYDLMNDIMSGGLHRLWKRAFVAAVAPRPGERFLDVAGGTGDIALRILDKLAEHRQTGAANVTVLDINPDMLAVGKARAARRGVEGGLAFLAGDAEALPLADGAADVYTIAFGIRNVTHIERALAEARRVLSPGGRFFCLEFSPLDTPFLDTLYDAYSFHLIPRFGRWIANDEASYRYLVESIRRFPAPEAFAAMMRRAGFERVRHRRLSGGIVAIHQGWRL